MKTRIVLGAIALLLTTGMSRQMFAQANARGLFVGKKADGLEIRILKFQDGKLTLVDPSETFKSGDSIRIQFRSNFDGYVYFINVSPSGVSKVIYKDKIKTNALNELPGGQDVITFDKEVGTEILKLVMSRDQIQVFEDAVSKADGTLGQSPGSAASELSSNKPEPKAPAKSPDKVSETVGIVPPDNQSSTRCRGLEMAMGTRRCRGLQLAPGNPKKDEGTVVVAIPEAKAKAEPKTDPKAGDPKAGDPKAADPKTAALKPGDAAVIEIRLKHI
jgi:Domain of unknown function (DUF4384)